MISKLNDYDAPDFDAFGPGESIAYVQVCWEFDIAQTWAWDNPVTAEASSYAAYYEDLDLSQFGYVAH